ncbi:uncharacterized protein Dwil_GK17666 [Drosophila willistoni]|uniref:Peptidase M14 domain-containing protein n=1 Tax=Drosophila willistoni TaxID=7260 RepID=B4NPC2_DROWI|nr:uncharacterized protein LOC6653123 [Drosophila willistoni]EDW86362.1 uncharacterized protein Dwil_GK17666 [Drosophila willistoni]
MPVEVKRLHLVIHWLLIQSFVLCLAYDFGYHPSAEEFDSLLRETRTWTRDLLADKRQRERFVPRYRQRDQRHDYRPELDFQMFSQEQEQQQQEQPYVYETVEEIPEDMHHQPDTLQVQSQLIEIHEPSAAAGAAAPHKTPSRNATSFPIFFTNPATGIVYALSEVGGSQPRNDSGTGMGAGGGISIYVTKAQYDADLKALQQHYEEQCALAVAKPPQPQVTSVLSTPNVTPPALATHRPQIIRLEKPKRTTAPRPSNKLPPKPTPRPPPIMVTSRPQNSISDQLLKLPSTRKPIQSTTRRTPVRKTKRKKRKKKTPTGVKRRPGHKMNKSSTDPPAGPANGAPTIVIGKRPSTTSKMTTRSPPAATQVEKPRMPQSTIPTDTIFSISQQSNGIGHHIERRSLEAATAAAKRVGNSSRRRPKSKPRRKKNKKPETLPPPTRKTEPHSPLPHAVHLLHRRRQNSTESPTTESKRRQLKRRRGEGLNFDLFDLVAGEDYDDDDDFYYNDGGEEDLKESSYTSTETQSVPHEDSSSAEEGADFGALVEEPLPVTSTMPQISSFSNEDTESKNSLGNKRIRRRPTTTATNSDEDYDDEDDDDPDGDSGIGGFFRMIFYPVQVAMSRIFDGFSGSTDEDNEVETSKPKYPGYTLYHSAHSNEALAEDDDVDDDDEAETDGSLGSWFSSWFGFQRRTKKIASTTVIPVPPAPLPTPPPTQAPGWLESWFGFGKATTESAPEAASSEDDYDKWFSGWFDSKPKPKARRRTTSTTTSTSTTTTPIPQVPILTIVDPLRNPQNWIGILAHHIVNSTGTNGATQTTTTTTNPLLQALVTRMTTTTPQPDLPRRISYDKYQIWRLKPQDEPQVRALEQFKKGEDGNKLQWLKGPSLRGLTDVLVPPKMLIDFQGTLNFEGIAHEVLIFDVGKAIAYEQTKEEYLYTTPMSLKRPTVKPPAKRPPMTWNKYHDYDDIVKYLETIRMRHAQLIELIHIGRTYEGRPLIVVKIESKQSAAAAAASATSIASGHKRLRHKRRPGQANAVFIEAGAQGLAWIGPAAATWMISELLRLMKSNKSDEEHDFVRNTTWYIMPVLNPDGYAYSHEYDRFWRKSRSQHAAKAPSGLLDSAMTWLQQKRGPNKVCYGVDLDRNWLYQWGKRGSSKAPCNEFYAGPAPFSEPETKAVSDFLMDYRTQIKLYISLQAYGQVVSYPVKANSTFNSERLDDFLDVAMVGTDGLRKKGSKSRYKVDSANDLIEQRSGCADAFAAYEIGIPFSYTLQLADNGVHGYLLPSSAIESTSRDAFDIICGMLDYI